MATNLVDLEIARKLHDYPSLYNGIRDRALDHLFCVIGNGYKWVNGFLLEEKWDYENDILYVTEPDANVESPYPDHYKMAQNKPFTLNPAIGYWYALWEYSHILNIPDDVHPDFLEAAVETAAKILRTAKPSKSRYMPGAGITVERDIKEWESNIAHASALLNKHISIYEALLSRELREAQR